MEHPFILEHSVYITTKKENEEEKRFEKHEACEVKSLQNAGGLLPSGICASREMRGYTAATSSINNIAHGLSLLTREK